jgi:hypothetical protein
LYHFLAVGYFIRILSFSQVREKDAIRRKSGRPGFGKFKGTLRAELPRAISFALLHGHL